MAYYLKERHNPQFDKPFYVKYGPISAAHAKRLEQSIYGTNHMLHFKDKIAYETKIEELKAAGFHVH